jgi:hypothetical protein
MKKMGLFWFAVLLGAALIFSGCEGETTTETNTVLIGYDVLVNTPKDLEEALAGYSYVAYDGGTLSSGGGSFTIPVGKTLGLYAPITYPASAGTLVVDGALNVEFAGWLDHTSFDLISGGGPINVKAGGGFSVGDVIPAGLTVTGGDLIYAAASPVPGTLSTLWGKVIRGQLTVTAPVATGPKAIIDNITGISKNKKLTITVDSPHGSNSALIIPAGLFLTTPGLTDVGNVTINGGGRLIFSGAPGSLSLAAGSVFTLNKDGEFDAPTTTTSGSLGLVLGGGKINITGAWSGGSGNAEITGAAAGGTVSGVLNGSSGAGTITQGSSSLLTLAGSTTIDLNGGLITLQGTLATNGTSIYFTDNTSRVLTGTVSGGTITGGTLTGGGGGSMTNTTLTFGTVSGGGNLASIAGSAGYGASLTAGTFDTFNLSSGTVVTTAP